MKDAEENHRSETIRELLKVSENQQQMQKLVQLHQAESPEAKELMKGGQQVCFDLSRTVVYSNSHMLPGIERYATGSPRPTPQRRKI